MTNTTRSKIKQTTRKTHQPTTQQSEGKKNDEKRVTHLRQWRGKGGGEHGERLLKRFHSTETETETLGAM